MYPPENNPQTLLRFLSESYKNWVFKSFLLGAVISCAWQFTQNSDILVWSISHVQYYPTESQHQLTA